MLCEFKQVKAGPINKRKVEYIVDTVEFTPLNNEM